MVKVSKIFNNESINISEIRSDELCQMKFFFSDGSLSCGCIVREWIKLKRKFILGAETKGINDRRIRVGFNSVLGHFREETLILLKNNGTGYFSIWRFALNVFKTLSAYFAQHTIFAATFYAYYTIDHHLCYWFGF